MWASGARKNCRWSLPPGTEPLTSGGTAPGGTAPEVAASPEFAATPATTPAPTTTERIKWGRVVLVSLSGIVSHTFGRSTVSVLLPAMANDLALSSTVAGALGSVNLGGYFCGVLVVTVLAGRIEPLILLRVGITIVAAGLVVLATAASTAAVLVGTGLGGLGGAGIWLTVPLIVTEGVSHRRRGTVMGTLTATMGAGFIAIPIGITLLRNLGDDDGLWRPVWLWEVGGTALLLTLLCLLVRSRPTSRISRVGGLGLLRNFPGWKRAVAAYMAFAWIAASFSQFLGLTLEEGHGLGREFATLLYSGMGFGTLVGAIGFGRLSDSLGRTRTMALVMAISAVTTLAIPYGSPAVVAVSVVLFGASSYAYPALTAAFVNDRTSGRSFSAVLGTMTIFYGPASIVGPAVSGALIDWTGGYTSTYLVISALAAFAALCMVTLGRPAHSDAEPASQGGPAD